MEINLTAIKILCGVSGAALLIGIIIVLQHNGRLTRLKAIFRQENLFWLLPVIMVCMACFYFFITPSEDGHIASLGELGDFVGGLMNPTLTFFTVVLLLKSLRQEKDRIENEENRIKRNRIRAVVDESKRNLDKLLREKRFQCALNLEKVESSYLKFSVMDCYDDQNENRQLFHQALMYSASTVEENRGTWKSPEEQLWAYGKIDRKCLAINVAYLHPIRSLTKLLVDAYTDEIKNETNEQLRLSLKMEWQNIMTNKMHTVFTEDEHRMLGEKFRELIDY